MDDHLEIMELRSTIARRDAVIRVLEDDLRTTERKRRKLHVLLAKICREKLYERCGAPENCVYCETKKVLAECE